MPAARTGLPRIPPALTQPFDHRTHAEGAGSPMLLNGMLRLIGIA
jgi:hypothetical protein